MNGPAFFSHVKFSVDGKYLLGVVEGRIYVLDAFDGRLIHKLLTGVPDGAPALEACFSCDAQFVLSGALSHLSFT